MSQHAKWLREAAEQIRAAEHPGWGLVAKVAGIEIVSRSVGHLWVQAGVGLRVWNPREDDGDALRLAVILHMGVQSNGPDHWQSPNCTIVLFEAHGCPSRLTQSHDGDPAAATRRAIMRAAAKTVQAHERGAQQGGDQR